MSIRIDGTNTTANPGITGSDTDTGLQFGTNEVKIVTDGSDRVTVDSLGRIGLDATPTAQFTGHSLFQIGAQASLGANKTLSTTGQTYLTHNLYFDTDGNYQVFNTGSANEGSIIQLVDGSIRFRTSAATTGTPSVGERVRIDADGLKFNGDTAAANALDDYEEGTWTPTINITTTPITGITYTRQAGYYTRIGNVCHVSMWITWSARTNTSSSTACISLPFTSYNSSNYRGAMHISTENVTYNGYGFDSSSSRNIGAMAGTHLNTNVAYMELSFTGKNGGGWGSAGILVNGLSSSGGDMQLAGTYMVN